MQNKLKKTDERADLAYKLENELRDTKKRLGTGFIEIGRILREIRDNGYYVELGYETITDWLSSPDVSITPAWAYHFIAIYETFILEHKIKMDDLAGIDYTKLRDIVPVVRENPKKIEEWIDKARELRRIDLRRELQEFKVKREAKLHEKVTAEQKPLQQAIATLTRGNWLDESHVIEQNSVDCIITTPPIVVTKREYNERNGLDGAITVDDYAMVRTYYEKMVDEFCRVLADNRSMFIRGNMHNIFLIADILRQRGLMILRDIIWFKRRVKVQHNPFNLIKSHETILWVRKGMTHTNNLTEIERDVWEMANWEVMFGRFVEIATYEKQLVYDPFVENDGIMDIVNGLERRFIGNKK